MTAHLTLRTALFGALAAALLVPFAAFAATSVIHPGDLQGWSFTAETGDSVGSMVNGPATAPLGTGSANLTTDSSDDGSVLGKLGYVGLAFADIDTLEYSTYVADDSTSTVQTIALQFNADDDVTDADTGWKGRLVFEPYYTETVVKGQWQTWDTMTQGKWWGTGATIAAECSIGSPCTFSELLTAFPNVGVNSSFGGVLLKAGSGWPAGFDGNVDALTIESSANGIADTYDFERDAPIVDPAQKAECKKGGWEDFGFTNQGQCVRFVNTDKDSRE